MATFSATKVTVAATARLPPLAQLRVARAGTFRCAYSKDGVKAPLAMNLSLLVLKRTKAMELRSLGPSWWGPGLVEEQTDTEDTRVQRLSRALNPESQWFIACVVSYIFFNRRR